MRYGHSGRRFIAYVLSIVLIMLNLFASVMLTGTVSAIEPNYVRRSDASTSDQYTAILGTDTEGGRYAGRVWTDKSVFTSGLTNIDKIAGANVSLLDGENFLVQFSALGSSRKINARQSTPIDLVLVLDLSTTMVSTGGNNSIDRVYEMVDASNELMNSLLTANKNSRVGVVTYSREATISMPLDRYELDEFGKDKTEYLRVQYSPADNGYQVLANVEDKTISSMKLEDGAYTQQGIYTGMRMLMEEKETSADMDGDGINDTPRQPVVVAMSDGTPDRFSNGRNGNWWEPQKGVKEHQNYAAGLLETIMTASYWKKQVTEHYNNNAKIYTVGIDIPNDYTDYAAALLNPRASTLHGVSGISGTNPDKNSHDINAVGYAFNAWNLYCQNTSFTMDLQSSGGESYKFTHPKDQEDITGNLSNVYYADLYYDIKSNDLLNMIDDIFADITANAFLPTTDTIGQENESGITYTDPIGRYMEVKAVKSILLFGKQYFLDGGNTAPDGTTTYRITPSQTIVHPVLNTEFNTDSILIQVSKDANGMQMLTANIPSNAIPLRCETVILDSEGRVMQYHSNKDSAAALPLRVLYSIGMQKEYMTNDGMVNLSKIDEEYLIENTDPKTGNVLFYPGFYDGQNTYAGSAGNNQTVGNATVRFAPNKQNRYYYFQKNRVIYTFGQEGICGEGGYATKTLSDISALRDDETYYLVIDYYRGNNGGESVEMVVARTGAELRNSLTYISVYELPEGLHAAIGTEYPEKPDDINEYVVATRRGGVRLGRLNRFASLKTSAGHTTDTAEFSYAPVYTGSGILGESDNFTVYLGNNGRLEVQDASLLIENKLTYPEGITPPKTDYSFTLTFESGAPGDGTYEFPLYEWTESGWTAKKTGNTIVSLTFSNGSADFTLGADEAVFLSHLVPGSSYTVQANIDKLNEGLANGRYALSDISGKDGTAAIPDKDIDVKLGTISGKLPLQNNEDTFYDSYVLFSHEYGTAVTRQFRVSKMLTGRSYQNNDIYHFTVSAGASNAAGIKVPMPEKTKIQIKLTDGAAAGTVVSADFGEITFTEPGTYYYLIAEDRPNAQTAVPGVSYDPILYRVIVTVTPDQEGTGLTAAMQWQSRTVDLSGTPGDWTELQDYTFDSSAESVLLFRNAYDADVMTRWLSENVKLTGRPSPLKDQEFGFIMEAQGSHPVTIEEAKALQEATISGNQESALEMVSGYDYSDFNGPMPEVSTVQNDNAGGIRFGPIQFRSWNAGSGKENDPANTAELLNAGRVYKYTVKQNIPEGGVRNGVTYDDSVKTVYLYVHTHEVEMTAYDENGNVTGTYTQLQIHADPYGDRGATFVNTYHSEATIDLSGTKNITGRDFIIGDTFRFDVTALDGVLPTDKNGDPVPYVLRTIDADQAGKSGVDFAFGTLRFSQNADSNVAGKVFRYTLTEAAGTAGGVAYDTAARQFTVTVQDDSLGHMTLSVEATGSAADTITIKPDIPEIHAAWTNQYTPTPIGAELYGVKNLIGGTFAAGDFSFSVKHIDESGNSESGTSYVQEGSSMDGVHTGIFWILRENYAKYTSKGTYRYLVTENRNASVIDTYFDPACYRVTVTIEDDNHGTLSVGKILVEKQTGEETWEEVEGDSVNQKVVFNNRYLGEPSLTVSKTVVGEGENEDRRFDFTVTLISPSAEVDFSDTYYWMSSMETELHTLTFVKETDGKVKAALSLRHGERVRIYGLPLGTRYEVAEMTPEGYVVAVSGGKGVVIEASNPRASFTNIETKKTLSVSEAVDGTEGEKDRVFPVELHFYDSNGTELTGVYDYYGVYEIENISAPSSGRVSSGQKINLKHGQGVIVVGLPAGTRYTVTEIDANTNGYSTHRFVDGSALGIGGTAEGKIVPEQASSVKFMNARTPFPSTGGKGTGIFYVTGGVLLFSAAACYFGRRMRRKQI